MGPMSPMSPMSKKRAATLLVAALLFQVQIVLLLDLCNDGLEGLGVVDCEVSKHLAVDLDTGLVQSAHQS